MRLRYRDQVQTYNSPNLDFIWLQIQSLIKESDEIFSHLLINDLEVYENHYEFLQKNFDVLKAIEIVTNDKKQYLSEIINSLSDYLGNVISYLPKLSAQFYEVEIKDPWPTLHDLIEGLEWIIEVTYIIEEQRCNDELSINIQEWNDIYTEAKWLKDFFLELTEAIENQDRNLLGDMLMYEILPFSERIYQKIKSIKKNSQLN